jgi:hypothetical protein
MAASSCSATVVEEDPMYAVFVEVDANESHVEMARKMLNEVAVPGVRASGGTAGFWLAPAGGRGVSVTVYDTEAQARAAADTMKVGEIAAPGSDVTFRTVEVREVLASL